MDTDAAAAPAAEPAAPAGPHAGRLARLRDILSGKTPIALYLDFLYRCVGFGAGAGL